MDIKTLIHSRYSVRSFLPDPIAEDVLSQILEAGRWAPSTQNRQPWRFIVLTDSVKIKDLSVNCGLIGLSNFFIRSAPCVIIACADSSKGIRINSQDYYLVDTAIAFQQMMLLAWDYGIGSCWMAAFSEAKMRKWLNLPSSWRIVALSPFGYPAPQKSLHAKVVSSFAQSRKRLPLKDTVKFL